MSGPEPGALPMMSRIGFSGKAGCAARAPVTAHIANSMTAHLLNLVRI
jgi:hypothetical protein